MSDLITRTARLVPYVKRPKQVPSFVTTYTYEPMAGEPGDDLGNLYVVTEVLVSGRASEEVADLILETAGDSYYNKPSAGTDPLSRFEAAIKAINHELSEYVNRGNASWIGKLSTVLAIQVGPEVHVAQTGSAEAFLYRGNAATHISGGGPSKPSTPSKTFGSIATGKIEIGDRILLATPALIHQVPLAKLQSIVAGSSPNSAIAEITDLLRGTSVERIAALVIEITTPEIAALQVRSEEPSEIQLGTPENALDAAKIVAAPIAQNTVTQTKRVASVAHAGWIKARPKAKAVSLALADHLRQILSTKRGRRLTILVLCIILVAIIGFTWRQSSSSQSAKYFQGYQADYHSYVHGLQLLSQGDRADASANFTSDSSTLASLKAHSGAIDHELATSKLISGEPGSYAKLSSLIDSSLNTASSLSKVTGTTVVSFATNSKPSHMELFDGNAYVFDAANNNDLTIVNLQSGTQIASFAKTSKLGDVVSTTISSANDGIYILTSQPALWFYQFSTDSITQEVLTSGHWPSASSVASYASNIYLLGSSGVYKSVRYYSDFATPTSYVSPTDKTAHASSLAVNGSIYIASPLGIERYSENIVTGWSPAPVGLTSLTSLRSTDNNTVIVGTDPTSHRVGLWLSSTSGLTFDKQAAIEGVGTLYDSTYDPTSGDIYATVDHRLIRFPLAP